MRLLELDGTRALQAQSRAEAAATSQTTCNNIEQRNATPDTQSAQGARLLNVARLHALEAHAIHRLPQRVVDAAANEALAEAAVVERLNKGAGGRAGEEVV